MLSKKLRKIKKAIVIISKLIYKWIIFPFFMIIFALFTLGNGIFAYLWLKEKKRKNIGITKNTKMIKPN